METLVKSWFLWKLRLWIKLLNRNILCSWQILGALIERIHFNEQIDIKFDFSSPWPRQHSSISVEKWGKNRKRAIKSFCQQNKRVLTPKVLSWVQFVSSPLVFGKNKLRKVKQELWLWFFYPSLFRMLQYVNMTPGRALQIFFLVLVSIAMACFKYSDPTLC